MRTVSFIILFLLMTSAVVPEFKRAGKFIPSQWETELNYIEPYFISKKKMDIEHLKVNLRISIKEAQIKNIR